MGVGTESTAKPVKGSDIKILDIPGVMAVLKEITDDDNAVECAHSLLNIAATWDDMVDKDKDHPPIAQSIMVDKALMDALFLMDTNPFWASFKPFLMPIVIVGINGYLDSRMLEVHTDDDVSMEIAFYSRFIAFEIIPAIAFCASGFSGMREASLACRRSAFYLTLDEWKAKLRESKQTKEKARGSNH